MLDLNSIKVMLDSNKENTFPVSRGWLTAVADEIARDRQTIQRLSTEVQQLRAQAPYQSGGFDLDTVSISETRKTSATNKARWWESLFGGNN